MDFDLDPLECRVLGCLLEKQLSTPDIYPLSLNSLLNACNQSSNRDPVLSVSEDEVQAAVDTLIGRGLAEHWPGRVVKIAHTAKPTWNLSVQEAALLAEMLLRGPQTSGELRTNTRRMYAFPDLAEVEGCLAVLMEAEPPLVQRLPGPRAPGRPGSRSCWRAPWRPAPPRKPPPPARAAWSSLRPRWLRSGPSWRSSARPSKPSGTSSRR